MRHFFGWAILALILAAPSSFADTYVLPAPAPAVTYYAPPPPVVSYYPATAPVITYSSPAPVYYSPPVFAYSYSVPAPTYYAAPVFAAPAAPVVSYYRYGLFGRRVISTTYYPSGPVVVPSVAYYP
jgi:hypothetical protein